jgi:hypothetical protein
VNPAVSRRRAPERPRRSDALRAWRKTNKTAPGSIPPSSRRGERVSHSASAPAECRPPGGARPVTVVVEGEGPGGRPALARVTARSIREARDLARDEAGLGSARVVFPIDPDRFFGGAAAGGGPAVTFLDTNRRALL